MNIFFILKIYIELLTNIFAALKANININTEKQTQTVTHFNPQLSHKDRADVAQLKIFNKFYISASASLSSV